VRIFLVPIEHGFISQPGHCIRTASIKYDSKLSSSLPNVEQENTAEELTDAPAFNAMIACEVPLISDLLAYINR
jgi:hypothetical protein